MRGNKEEVLKLIHNIWNSLFPSALVGGIDSNEYKIINHLKSKRDSINKNSQNYDFGYLYNLLMCLKYSIPKESYTHHNLERYIIELDRLDKKTFNEWINTNIDMKEKISITANELIREVFNNPKSAEKYTDKSIELTGKVFDVDENDDETSVFLQTGVSIGAIQCVFKNKINVKKGQNITLEGVCFLYTYEGVLINDCKLTKC